MARVSLKGNEVHVWQAALVPGPAMPRLLALLSPDEHAQAGRFRHARDRDRYILSHAFLRAVLGRYLGMDPARLAFSYGPHGKPALACEACGDALRFNLTHAHELALLAVAWRREIGIDAEHVRPDLPHEEIARQFLACEEMAALEALPLAAQPWAFCRLWTRKEAYLKARGDGLAFPPDRVHVSPADEPAALLSAGGDVAEAARWSLYDLAPTPGYVATLAVQGQPPRLRQWHWPEG